MSWQSFTITFRLRVFVFFASPRCPEGGAQQYPAHRAVRTGPVLPDSAALLRRLIGRRTTHHPSGRREGRIWATFATSNRVAATIGPQHPYRSEIRSYKHATSHPSHPSNRKDETALTVTTAIATLSFVSTIEGVPTHWLSDICWTSSTRHVTMSKPTITTIRMINICKNVRATVGNTERWLPPTQGC